MSHEKMSTTIDEFARKASDSQHKGFAADLQKLRAQIAEIEEKFPELEAINMPKNLTRPAKCECGHGWHGVDSCQWRGEEDGMELHCECPPSHVVFDEEYFPAQENIDATLPPDVEKLAREIAPRLEEIEERAAKATVGPWKIEEYRIPEGRPHAGERLFELLADDRPLGKLNGDNAVWLTSGEDEGNADFIAHAREDIPFLLAVLRRSLQPPQVEKERDSPCELCRNGVPHEWQNCRIPRGWYWDGMFIRCAKCGSKYEESGAHRCVSSGEWAATACPEIPCSTPSECKRKGICKHHYREAKAEPPPPAKEKA